MFRRIFMVVFVLAAAAACSVDPEVAKREHLQKGDAYLAQQKPHEAIVEYRNAVQQDPRFAEAHYKLGESYAAVSDVKNALGAYVRASDLDPDNVGAQLKAGQLLLLARQYEEAKARARKVLGRDPDNGQALLLLGNALAGLRSFDEAVAATQRAVALDPTRSGAYVNLGAIEYIRGNAAEAEAAYQAAIAAEPTSIPAIVGLADFYWLSGKPVDAEREYRHALGVDINNVAANRALSAFYIESGRAREAEPFLRRVAETTRSATAYFALADFFVATERRGAARDILGALQKQTDTFVDASLRLSLIDYIEGRRPAALALVDQVLAKQPKHAEALARRAHLLLADRKRPEALAAATTAIEADPKSPAAHFAHGMVAKASGQPEVARTAFTEVLKLNPSSMEALIELAELNLARRQIESATAFAEQAVKANPAAPDARITLARVLASRPESHARAKAELAQLQKQLPNSVSVHTAAGRLALAANDGAGARQAFSRALDLDPVAVDPLIELVKMDMGEGRPAEARRRAEDALSKLPDSPELLLVAAKAHAPADAAVAERYLRKVIELDPSNIDAFQTLAGVYLQQNRLADARAEFIAIAARQPASIAPPTMVGILFEVQGNTKDAQVWYEKALQINGRASTAANNLAWLYAERGENLEVALQLAQVAHGEMPNQPEVTDTLGWVYLKKNMMTFAVRTLEDCVAQEPTTPLYHYHLGIAYAESGQDAKARQSLQQALKLDAAFSGAGDARRRLAALLY